MAFFIQMKKMDTVQCSSPWQRWIKLGAVPDSAESPSLNFFYFMTCFFLHIYIGQNINVIYNLFDINGQNINYG